jgi:peptidoglycan/xylan/chitin deacetylase (PgdA/CDA1 family)
MKKLVRALAVVAGAGCLVFHFSWLAAGEAPIPSPARLSFGSRIVLEALWTPQELQRAWSPYPPQKPPPAGLKPRTPLPPVPPGLQQSIRGVKPLDGRRVVALTFDLCEGPREVSGYDAGVVNYLRAHQVKATFFAGGKWLRSHPEKAMQLMADPRFELGNHSWDHPHFQSLGEAAMEDQIQSTQAEYEALWQELDRQARARGTAAAEMAKIPKVPALFRFPYGTCSPLALSVLARLGLPAIQWSIVTGDPAPRQYAQRIAQAVLRNIHPGAIIICHANGRGTYTSEALPLFVPQLIEQGYTLVTVSELLRSGPAVAAAVCRP